MKTSSHEEIVEAIRSVAKGKRVLSAPLVDKLVTQFSELAREMERHETGMDQ